MPCYLELFSTVLVLDAFECAAAAAAVAAGWMEPWAWMRQQQLCWGALLRQM